MLPYIIFLLLHDAPGQGCSCKAARAWPAKTQQNTHGCFDNSGMTQYTFAPVRFGKIWFAGTEKPGCSSPLKSVVLQQSTPYYLHAGACVPAYLVFIAVDCTARY